MILNPNIGEIVEMHGNLYMVFERNSEFNMCGTCDLKTYGEFNCGLVFCTNRKSLESKNREYRLIETIIC